MNLEDTPAVVAILLILTIILLLLTVPLILVGATLRRRSESVLRRRGTVIAQYAAPYDLSPAEIGFLYDMRCDGKEIAATVFDLQARALVSVAEDGIVQVRPGTDFAALTDYEQIMVRMYDQHSRNLGSAKTISFSAYDQITGQLQQQSLTLPLSRSKQAFTAAVQHALTEKGYKTHGYLRSLWLRIIVVAVIVSLWPLILVAIGGTYNGQAYAAWSLTAVSTALATAFFTSFFLWPLYLFIGFVLIKIWIRIAGLSWLNTRQVRRLWPELEGYRLFLKTVDLDAIQAAYDNGTTTSKAVLACLPYAMVFNLDTKWRQKLRKSSTVFISK